MCEISHRGIFYLFKHRMKKKKYCTVKTAAHEQTDSGIRRETEYDVRWTSPPWCDHCVCTPQNRLFDSIISLFHVSYFVVGNVSGEHTSRWRCLGQPTLDMLHMTSHETRSCFSYIFDNILRMKCRTTLQKNTEENRCISFSPRNMHCMRWREFLPHHAIRNQAKTMRLHNVHIRRCEGFTSQVTRYALLRL